MLPAADRDEIVANAVKVRDSRLRGWLIAIVALLLVLAAVAVASFVTGYRTKTRQASAGADLAAQVQAVCSAPNPNRSAAGLALCRRAEVVVKRGLAGPVGPTGATGAAGTNGTNGVDGADATAAQVQTAVAAYCSIRRDCAGSTGASGKNGTDGKDGASITGPQGPQGPAGKDGADGKNGLDGKDGNDGLDGAPGRGISAVACSAVAPGTSFAITYTDGTTDTVDCS